MHSATKLLNQAIEVWHEEDTKFATGNSAAGTRARKALAEIAKIAKLRRSEITAEKLANKEAKAEQ